jgi:Asp/Glu/hydantoin racemase
LTTKELTAIAAETTRATAENTKAIAQLTTLILTQHESIKSLEVIARSHDELIEELAEGRRNLEAEWQAYVKRLPRT